MRNNNSFYDIFEAEKERFTQEKILELKKENNTQEQIDDFLNSEDFYEQYVINYVEFIEKIVTDNTKDLIEINNDVFNEKKAFLSHLEGIYGKPFLLFDTYINLAIKMGNEYYIQTCELYKNSDKQDLIGLFKILNGTAIRTTSEIVCLLKNGFPHGAIARWRSLYETWIIMEYISRHGNSMAKKFVKHSNYRDSYAWAASSLVTPKYSKYSFEDLQTYIHGELDKNILTQNESKITYSDWIDEYRLSNKILHTSSTGILGYWDIKQKSNEIYTSGSAVGFLKPATNTIGCLYNINHCAYSMFEGEYGDLLLLLLKNLSNKIMESFDIAINNTPNE